MEKFKTTEIALFEMTPEIALIKNNLTGLKIREHRLETIKSALAMIIQTLFVVAGQTPDKEDIAAIVKEVCADLQKRYKGMTLEEVDHALNAGVRGEYGEYFGINVVSINKWIRTYYNSDDRRKAQISRIFPELPQQTKPTPEEMQKIRKAKVEFAWTQFCEYGYCRDFGNVAYNFLDSKGLISFTAEEKKEMMEYAEKEIKNTAKNNYNVFQVVAILDRITMDKVIYRAKVIALNVFFERLKNEGKNVNLLIAE